jgi:hypothetical protein
MLIMDKKLKGERILIQVKLFDREHEKDLEKEMNRFLKGIDERKLVDIKYDVAAIPEEEEEEQIYCFTAMIIYRS